MRYLNIGRMALLLVLAFGIAPAAAQPFGGLGDVSFADKLWQSMKQSRLVGASAYHATFYEGVEPHGFILETLEADIQVAGRTGHVIVKRNYGPEGINAEDVANDPDRYLKAVTVMFRRESGYDADNLDWFWGKYAPDGSLLTNPAGEKLAGRVAKGRDAGCIACHSAAPGDDYVYNHDRFAR